MTLETLIEDEKKKARTETQNHCQKRYEGILQQEVIDGTVSYWGKRTDTLLTYAMPRAYKAGREETIEEILNLEECKSGCGCTQQNAYHEGYCVWQKKEYLERSDIEGLSTLNK